MTRVLIVDNYDSFTWNLVHLIGPLASAVDVVRNDEIGVDEILAARPDAVVLSPGPCTPNEAGICLELVRRAADRIPLFGVCLGLQAMGQAFGGDVVRAPTPMHGKVSKISHTGSGLFHGLNGPFEATRYHSLVVDRASCPASLAVTAHSDDGLVMALAHRDLPLHGVQFHPESVLSQHGSTLVRNFLRLAGEWNAAADDRRPSGVH